jgi:hypothetical protein
MAVQITLSYPFLVSRYLMVAGLNMETRHKRLDKASAYLLFATINSAEFIGWRGLHSDNCVIGEEGHHAFYVMSVPRSVVVLYY